MGLPFHPARYETIEEDLVAGLLRTDVSVFLEHEANDMGGRSLARDRTHLIDTGDSFSVSSSGL